MTSLSVTRKASLYGLHKGSPFGGSQILDKICLEFRENLIASQFGEFTNYKYLSVLNSIFISNTLIC
jgi:hypothetical protein